ncbi:exo-beta-N-acetylmuramidase NamZ family protein [Thermorudis peleae]|uniref:exo-beta-N-acetylmuramidase NamZ family protein n=1 Tax=Thermorudis peleae TaxID=1382356 RepID=UPI0005708B35|nr:DUF1343 domain-containing protein [Thermorudis peleae]
MDEAGNLSVIPGVERLKAEGWPLRHGARVGLLTNPTGVDRQLRSTVERLRASDWVKLVVLFGPEHGVWGDRQAGEPVPHTTDPHTGLPVYSLYGEQRAPTPAMLEGLDAIIVDLQDVGARFYTYPSTLFALQAAAAQAGVPVVVLDRPNPLGGAIEGPRLDPSLRSFVGIFPLPIRHGLTLGELARLFAQQAEWPEPIIVPVAHWRRSQRFDQTGLPWVPPSPNLPTLTATFLYPGTCLLEATNCSEGRGTTLPFQLVGAPWIDPFVLAETVNAAGLPGLRARPAYFIPQWSKHAGTRCGGVQLHVLDPAALQPVRLGITLLAALRAQNPDAFSWRQWEDGRVVIDLLAGTPQLRQALEAGVPPDAIAASWKEDEQAFAAERASVSLYPD